MPVHPQAQALLDFIAASGMDFSAMNVEEMRNARTLPPAENPEPVAKVEDRILNGLCNDIAVRIYTPEGEGAFKLIVYYHGGGFVIGDLESHDGVCRSLCNQAKAVVVAVDYRLAPEHKFPAAMNDAYDAAQWASENAQSLGADASKLIVAGDSAGGNLAAVVALRARDEAAFDIAFQLLIYPVTDMDFERKSYLENAEGFFLTRDVMRWFMAQYTTSAEQALDPMVCPLRAESLSGLPPALLITAEFDPLRDEGEAYAQALLEAGVKVELIRYSGMIHGFVSLSAMLDDGAMALSTIASKLKEVLD